MNIVLSKNYYLTQLCASSMLYVLVNKEKVET